MPGWACRRHAATDYGRGFELEMRYPLASFFLRADVAHRSKAAHIARSSPHQVVGIHHTKRFDVDEILYQHCVKKLLVGYLGRALAHRATLAQHLEQLTIACT